MEERKQNRYSPDHPAVVATFEMRARGLSINKIADAIGIHKAQVWRFLNTPEFFPAPQRVGAAVTPEAQVSPKMWRKAPVSRVDDVIIRAADGRPIDLHSVTSESSGGGKVYTIKVFVPMLTV